MPLTGITFSVVGKNEAACAADASREANGSVGAWRVR